MAFSKVYSSESVRALVAAILDDGRSVADVHTLAVAGRFPGVPAHDVPAIGTLKRYVTRERARRSTELEELEVKAGVDPLALAQKIAEQRVLTLARQTKRKRGSGTADEWSKVSAAIERAAKSRRALSERAPGRPPSADAPPDPQPQQPSADDALDSLPD
jgi:hypothetical protein